MFRLEGLSRAVREAFPAEHATLYELVTALGNATVILFGLATVYWAGRRRETATVTGYALVALSLTLALKAAFAMPRPPEAVRLVAETGYGFPSGHATAAAVVYGGLAYEYDYHRRAATAVPVAALVGAVALSRVVLGVHYLGDVLAGLALGVAVVVGVGRVAGGDPLRTFAVATACALGALATTGPGEYAALALGASTGGVVAATAFDRVPERRDRIETVATVVVGLAFVVGVVTLAEAVGNSPAVEGASNAVLVAGVLLTPVGVDRLAPDRPDLPSS